jgi:Sporulation and spore germination
VKPPDRTAVKPPGGRAVKRGAVAVLATLAVLAVGCGVPTGGGPKALPTDQVPFHLLDPTVPTTTSTTTTPGTAPFTVYFVDASQQYLTPAARSVGPSAATLTTVLRVLLKGPTPLEAEQGTVTAITNDVRLLHSSYADGVATVDFNQAFGEISGSSLILAVAQVVYTVVRDLGRLTVGVQFELDGVPLQVPSDTGAQQTGVVRVNDYLSLTPQTTTTTTTTAPPTTTTAPG